MDDINNTDRAWIRDLEFVFKYGNRVSPRGMEVYEAIAYQSVVPMANPIIFNEHRKLGYKFMAAEAAWILGGQDDVKSIAPYSKVITMFSDDNVSFYGAYGPRFRDQFDYVLAALANDQDSRQAVMTIWRQNPQPSKDIPCTVALQWLVRFGAIHCVATMRSSDLWLGHPYDIFNFSAATFFLMLHLNKERVNRNQLPLVLGSLHLNAGSKHIYERNAEDVGKLLEDFDTNGVKRVTRTPVFIPDRYDDPSDFIDHLWDVADSSRGALSLMTES